ncbi:hypothetical protein AGMMS49992_30880 [Clostridia bacterium]|nr:hypothetical protein AGMMS49992_30880 [Clostridia bacterium]
MSILTLGSLFDGSGGFPLGAILSGIQPIWASEVEPFCICVTTKRLQQVKHLGDINLINGANIQPVDIVTGGFCCQDLSVSGPRLGLHGERSKLFFQMVRIVREMRAATANEYPKYAVLENVPGMYSSNNGLDFQEVLNELVRLEDETLSIPMPESGRWSTAGEIVGDDFSLAWRTLDAQYWGVPQRRRRCYIVVDFAGERAGQILFDESRLSRDPASGEGAWKGIAGSITTGTGDTGGIAFAFEPGASSRLGGHVWENITGTLRADAGDNQTAVVYDARGNGDGATVNTIVCDHENRVTDYTALAVAPKAAAFMGGQGANARSIAYNEAISPTLRSEAGGNSVPMVMTAFGIGSKNSGGMLSTNPHAGIYEAATARTLDTSIPDPNKNAGGIAVVAIEGNGARPSHQGSGICEDGVSFTLNTTERHAVCYRDVVGTLCSSEYKFPQNQAIEGGKAIVEQYDNHYTVRRLTPQECALLQGFPPNWCAGLEAYDPTDEDIAFWTDVFATKARIDGKKPKSRNQIIKWLRNPHTDSAEYRMWGNGICVECGAFVLSGIVHFSRNPA